jgi:hypothetical protein
METGRSRRIVVALVVAHCVLHAIALVVALSGAFPEATMSLSNIFHCMWFMLGPSQGVLLAFWAILGGGKLLWRTLSTTLGTLIYVGCLFGVKQSLNSDWLIIVIGQLGISAAILLLARLAGFRLFRFSDSKATSGPFQFYIRDMLAWTTAIAVILSAWRCLPEDAFDFLSDPSPAMAFVSLSLVAVVSMFSTLGRQWLVARIVLLPTSVVVAAIVLKECMPGAHPTWFLAFIFCLMAFWLVGSFLVLRLAGYRLTWRRPFGRSQEKTASEALQTKV